MGLKMNLTKSNYRCHEADMEYMSASQVKEFLNCETKALAVLHGNYSEPVTEAMMVGKYIDEALTGDINKFKEDNPSIFSSRGETKGQLKSEFKHADVMIDKLLSSQMVLDILNRSEKQKIVINEIGGYQFKGMLDLFDPANVIIDLKKCQSIINPVYLDGKWQNFIEANDYVLQLAIYRELIGNKSKCKILAVSSEKPYPDIALINIDSDRMDKAIAGLKPKLDRIYFLKTGKILPIRCEKCNYCRKTKILNKEIWLDDLLLPNQSWINDSGIFHGEV